VEDTPVILPTRVISVGDEKNQPRLHTARDGEIGKYVALSHCWGSPAIPFKRLITTLGNLASHCHSIPLGEFPRTFKDAILVTRGIGLKYIWIDSLCIVQDDTADWEKEARKMASVYSNAYVTLAADWASHSDCGLISRGKKRPLLRSIMSRASNGGTYEIFLSLSPLDLIYPTWTESHDKLSPENLSKQILSTSNGLYLSCYCYENISLLEKRAWILQERVLSRFVVHFGYAELEWECKKERQPICQCGNLTPRNTPMDYHLAVRIEGSFVEGWQNIVSEYTSRQITYSRDRLPGIAGLASACTPDSRHPIGPGDYVAGMWTSYIPQLLSWYTVSEESISGLATHERMPVSYAPSWSWGSVAAPIKFKDLEQWGQWADYEIVFLQPTVYRLPALIFLASVIPIIIIDGQWIRAKRPPPYPYPYSEFAGCPVSLDAGPGSQEWNDKAFDYFAFPRLLMDINKRSSVGDLDNIILRKRKDEKDEVYSRIGFAWRLMFPGEDPKSPWRMGKKWIKII
jgi:hypothetical protein